ncbi:uncharacterized protein TNCV_3125251 [Trichonephila clavipes]|nr:uncharacterized protein TNCV_3125251 [Trichonephila clavipes]
MGWHSRGSSNRTLILPDRLTGPRYLIFLEQVLPELLDSAHVTAATRTSMWFQQDGAPAHFSISVWNHLDATCGERWIGHGGPVHWPFRSPDHSLFFLPLGANEILGVRNTRKQRRGTFQCSSRGNTKHSRNIIECSTLQSEDVKPASHAVDVSSNTFFDSSFSFFSFTFSFMIMHSS